jgi:ribokinase
MIIVVSGANAKLDSKIAKQAIAQMNAGDIILLNQEIPKDTVLTALKVAKKAKIKTIFNISPFSSSTKELAPLADIVIANANEFDELMGEKIIFEKLPKYLMQYAKDNNQTIIVTLGEKGAICANSNDIFTIKAPKVKPIDSVGAGDSFFGYFAAEIDRGKSLKQAVKKAIIAGSLATLKRGAQPSIPYKEQVENFIFD